MNRTPMGRQLDFDLKYKMNNDNYIKFIEKEKKKVLTNHQKYGIINIENKERGITMKTEKIIYTVAREGYSEQFKNRIVAKVVYKKMKKEYPETVLLKIIARVETLQFDDNSECWL